MKARNKMVVTTVVAVFCLFFSGVIHGPALAIEESTYPAITFSSFPGGVLFSVEGVRYKEAVDFTWNGESIAAQLQEAVQNGLIDVRKSPQGFELQLDGTPDMLGMIGDGVFGILLPTGSTISVPVFADTIIAEHNAKAVQAAGCSWLTVSAPTSIKPNSNCSYGSKKCAKPGWYHTGIDYSGSGSALAAANGVVTRVEKKSSGDHGMGNNVIIKHTLSDCSAIYSTYSHLDSIDSKMVVGKTVTRGQKVGTIGGSGYGKSNYWGRHLHFEMKKSPVTGSPWGGSYWGYTPSSPDNYGYSNPNNYIGK